VPTPSDRSRRDTQSTVVENRPEPNAYVYCKGCGAQLEDRSRLQRPKVMIEAMMCEPCQSQHNHALMPSPGSPTYCYRCGTLEEIVMEPSTTPITHHVCPACLPDRLERYRAGDFAPPPKAPAEAKS
jgi:hypothetical protein